MAVKSSTTPVKYTGLTHQELNQQLDAKLRADTKMDNFRASTMAQTIKEMFTGVADLINYYIERQAEESYLPTIKRKSSAIGAAGHFAYDITRPSPASTKISMVLKGDLFGKINAGDRLQIPAQSRFTYGGTNFILKKAFTYTFTTADTKSIQVDRANYSKTITTDDDGNEIELSEGVIKEITIEGSTNPFIDQIFQTYRVSDKTFSNKFGSEDFDQPVTKLWVGDSKTDANGYTIDRQSLINDGTIAGVISGDPIKCVVIRTAKDEGVEIVFGDAKIAELGATISGSGPSSSFDNIYLQYLSTTGSSSNRTGVIGEKVINSSSVYIGTQNLSNFISFKLTDNITGGSDLESVDSIKLSTPAIYSSLKRLVDEKDYVNYLKSLTSPINIKNALAWGEQQEAVKRNVSAIKELFNVGLFTCVGSLYNLDGNSSTSTYSARSGNKLSESILDSDPDEDGLSSQSYFNIYAKNNAAQQLKEQVIRQYYYEINGTESVSQSLAQLKATYDGDQTISSTTDGSTIPKIYIKSEKYLDASGAFVSVTLNIDDCIDMDGVASKLQSSLRGAIDTRSSVVGGIEQNPNYNLPAFPGVAVSWNSATRKFKITGGVDDPCYISFMWTYGITRDLGLYQDSSWYSYSEKLWTNLNYNFVSDKIKQVLDLVNKRSMIVMKHIYVSPVIQNFDISGKIYVNQLYDKESIRRQVNNSVYSYLDENADFNENIFLSNIIDKIEENAGVHHADVEFAPSLPSTPTTPEGRGTNFYPSIGEYNYVDSQGSTTRIAVYAAIIESVNKYFEYNLISGSYSSLGIIDILTAYTGTYSVRQLSTNWESFITDLRSKTSDEINSNKVYGGGTSTNNRFTEWKFLTGFMKDVYNSLKTLLGESGTVDPSFTRFQDKPEFRLMMSDIHKDLSWVIRMLMLDSNGNISPEYVSVASQFGPNTKSFLRGGHSLGSEIVKVNVSATYEYI